jgi:hypothetical protein
MGAPIDVDQPQGAGSIPVPLPANWPQAAFDPDQEACGCCRQDVIDRVIAGEVTPRAMHIDTPRPALGKPGVNAAAWFRAAAVAPYLVEEHYGQAIGPRSL